MSEELREQLEKREVLPNIIDDIIKMSTLTPEEFYVDDARIMEDAFKIADIFGGGYDVLPTEHKKMMLDNCIRLYSSVVVILQKNLNEGAAH